MIGKSEQDETKTFVTIELGQLKWIILSLNKHPSIVNDSLEDDVKAFDTMAPRTKKCKKSYRLTDSQMPHPADIIIHDLMQVASG